MGKWMIPAVSLALALTALAANAQSNNPHSAAGNASASTVGTSTPKGPMNQERLKKVLGEAGFQNVRVLDESFLVQAQTKDGDPVIMMINPPGPSTASATGGQSTGTAGSSTAMPPSGGASGSTSSSSSGSSK